MCYNEETIDDLRKQKTRRTVVAVEKAAANKRCCKGPRGGDRVGDRGKGGQDKRKQKSF